MILDAIGQSIFVALPATVLAVWMLGYKVRLR